MGKKRISKMGKIIQNQSIIAVTVVNVLAIFFAGVFGALIVYGMVKPVPEIKQVPVVTKIDPFNNIALQAQSVYVFDTVTGKVLYSKNGEAQLPLASVTKVMTALVASHAPQNTVVNVEAENLENGAGGLTLGETWDLKKLLDYTLVISSNSGASAIAGAAGAVFSDENGWTGKSRDIFVGEMNKTAHALGMNQTYYLNPNGLDESTTLAGAYGSAKDMTTLFSYILKNEPSLLSATTEDSLNIDSQNGVSHLAVNTNIMAHSVPGLLASKTGYTDLANGNLVIAFNVGPMHPVIVAVLGSSQEGRFTDVEKLVNASIAKIADGQ